ncbi:MAG: tyrosine-type recombinase/integrase [Clostridia bacterium]|nr:tyrosine-type recombinase/integrase [Clostridia bacterium]
MSRRGENIYRRKDGRWEGRYIKCKDLSGKTKYGYLYAKSYYEIKEKLKAIKLQPQDAAVTGSAKTLFHVCTSWLDETKAQIKHSTYVKYYNIIFNHILPSIGNYRMNVVDTALLKQFADEKLKNGKLRGKGGLSPKTVKDILSVLRLVIAYADNMGITCNCRLDKINIKSADKSTDVLSKSQQETLTDYLINNIDNTNLGILICLYTGIRIGEICALKFEDISMADKIIHIRKTMQRVQNFSENKAEKTNVIITSPKSKNSVRDIPLPDFIIQIIKGQVLYNPSAFLLSGDSLRFIEPRTLENRFKSCTSMCGIENVNFHMLRHTFATRCIELGFDIKSLSEILGHSSVNITLNRYVHSSMEQKRRNMNKLSLSPSVF